jgi:hypothetical protein
MTDTKRLAEIRARCEAATPGTWFVEVDDDGVCWIRIDGHDMSFGDMETTDKCCWDNATFIALSRRDVPWLLAEIEHLCRRIARLESMVDNGEKF